MSSFTVLPLESSRLKSTCETLTLKEMEFTISFELIPFSLIDTLTKSLGEVLGVKVNVFLSIVQTNALVLSLIHSTLSK